jgi:hypothetical protein
MTVWSVAPTHLAGPALRPHEAVVGAALADNALELIDETKTVTRDLVDQPLPRIGRDRAIVQDRQLQRAEKEPDFLGGAVIDHAAAPAIMWRLSTRRQDRLEFIRSSSRHWRKGRMAVSPGSLEHRRRVLEHQAKTATDRGEPAPADKQLTIPLIAEVKANAAAPKPKVKRKRARTGQPTFDGL